MARLAALVPPPRMHLTRFHGVFAPHSRLRALITPGGRGPGGKGAEEGADKPATPRHVAMRWAQRLKRVFGIEIEACARCGGWLQVIASAVTAEEEGVGNQVERSTCGGCTAAGREPCGRCQDRWR